MLGAIAHAFSQNRFGRARPGAAHAILHLLELLEGDAHGRQCARARVVAKAENRWVPRNLNDRGARCPNSVASQIRD